MKNYHDIKDVESKNVEKFSDKKLDRYIKAHKILRKVSAEFFFWFISFAIFMSFPLFLDDTPGMYLFFLVSHLICWKFFGTKWFIKEMTDLNEELDLTITVLEDIQKERHG